MLRTALWAAAAAGIVLLPGRRGLAPVASLVPLGTCLLFLQSSLASARACAGLARLAEDAVRQHR